MENSRAEEIRSEILGLKQLLTQSDYKALKYAEGQMSEEEYADVRKERQNYRDKINALEAELAKEQAE